MFPQRDCSRSPQEIGAGRITRPENDSRKQLLWSVHRLVRERQVSGSHSSYVTANPMLVQRQVQLAALALSPAFGGLSRRERRKV